jgi:hypothetical protein
VLVGHPQPADPLAAGQADLVGRVHLPGVVRGAGPGAAAAAGRGRGQARPGQPALDGARVRRGGVREAARQLDAQQAGPPVGVLAAQREGVIDPVGPPAAAGAAVARRVRAGGAEGAQQVADGARGQAEAGRQGGGVGVGLGGLPKGGPDRQRGGGGHGTWPSGAAR